jgi:hypothetical protein
MQRMLGYGTVKVMSNDETTPELSLVKVPRPIEVKEMIRVQYRAMRIQEGVHPTEFVQSS